MEPTTPKVYQSEPGGISVLYDEATRVTIHVDDRETYGSLGGHAWVHFIVAAPEMLTVLERLARLEIPTGMQATDDAVRRARALLCRARGEAL